MPFPDGGVATEKVTRCKHCGAEIYRLAYRWVHVASGDAYCRSIMAEPE